MPEKKAQISIEYLLITALILAVATMIFTYSYVTNNESIRINQANTAAEKITNAANLVYALGPGNTQYVEVTFPQGLEQIRDLTLCKRADNSTYEQHYGTGEESCPGDQVKAGSVELRLRLATSYSVIKSGSRVETEIDVSAPETAIDTEPGRKIIKVYWCGNRICASSSWYLLSEECLNGQTRDCSLNTPECRNSPECACSGALETCIGGVWPGCSKETYKDYNSSYENVETVCGDGIDNDCDGFTDCYDLTCETNPECACDDGETRLCELQLDICKDSTETCTARQWPGCGQEEYGPLYEPFETSCSDGLDNDCSGLIDCADADCVDDPACGFFEKTTVFMSTSTFQGDFGGKAAADAICQSEIPASLPSNCANTQALLCDSTHNILDMQTDYGGAYESEQPIYWWHNTNQEYNMLAMDWTDMLDGSILLAQDNGTGVATDAWTGCQVNGIVDPEKTCLDWTNKQQFNLGYGGMSTHTDSTWTQTAIECNGGITGELYLRCITECKTELNCHNEADDDLDGLTDCDDPDCLEYAECIPITEGRTTVYMATQTHSGSLGGRAGADSICENEPPSNLGECGNVHAFLSVNAADEIRDMPSLYGYAQDKPVYWWHNTNKEYNQFAANWADMLDGSISMSQEEGTGEAPASLFSGSNADGSVAPDTCNQWTSGSSSYNSTEGASSSTGQTWLSYISTLPECGYYKGVRCITECPAEADCSNNLDDDQDGLKDCADTDCAEDPACLSFQYRATIYIAATTHDGDFESEAGAGEGAREAADSFCTSNQPANLPGNCANTRAFLSVEATDEIQDIPTNYGYTSSNPVYWWHSTNGTYTQLASDWADMLDNSILVNQETGTGASDDAWSGSNSDGSLAENCLEWTNSSNQMGKRGRYNQTTGWLDSLNSQCISSASVRCITQCPAEADCSNGEDDDLDSLIDCSDPDCFGEQSCQPVSYYRFDDGSGEIAEDSTGNNDGTLLPASPNGPVWQTGPGSCVNESCLLFDGADDRVGMPVIASGTPFSVCAWFKAGSDADGDIFSESQSATDTGHTFRLGVVGSVAGDPVRVAVRDASSWAWADTTTGFTPGQWHHACGVFSSSTLREAYIDGGSKGTNTSARNPVNMNVAAIGRLERLNPALHFNGVIDEAKVWGRALSSAEICLECNEFAGNVGATCNC